MPTSPYYRHSGRVAPIGALATFLAAVVPAAIVGTIYGVLVWICPIIYANVLGTVGLGLGIGWLTWQAAKLTRVRNPAVAAVFGLLGGLTAVYFSWVAWIFALSDWEAIIIHPLVLMEIIPEIGWEGVWSLRGGSDPVSGVFLFAIWGLEALVIIGAATGFPYREMAKSAYCEPCGKWVEQRTVVGPFTMVGDAKSMKRRLEEGEFAALGELQPAPEEADAFSQIDLWRCEGCDDTHLMTLRTVEMTRNKKGELQRTDKEVVRNLIIDGESRHLIASLGETREAGAVAAEPVVVAPVEAANDAQPA